MRSPIFSDDALSRRLERAEATANKNFVETRARLQPASGAQWIEVAGAYAMYDGIDSPCTQTFGLGLFQMPTPADMERLEGFFRDRHAPVFHEISPLADRALLPLLGDRGYRPVDLTTVMFQSLADRAVTPSHNDTLQVRVAAEPERALWARTSAEGWRESPEVAALMRELTQVIAATEGTVPFLVELQGQPIATGALAIHDGVALFAGASTIPEWRRRGAQQALLEGRFQYAIQTGCDLAMMGAAPGSGSQRNAEREGFRIAYTRIKWALSGT